MALLGHLAPDSDRKQFKTLKTFFFKKIFFKTQLIKRPTRITRRSIAICHILTNSFLSTNVSSGILKTDIWDSFPYFFTLMKNLFPTEKENK